MILLGIIIGLLIACLVFSILAFFRAGIEKRVKIIETTLGNLGPRPVGAIFLPDSEEEEARAKIIKKNRKAGRDTNFDELR